MRKTIVVLCLMVACKVHADDKLVNGKVTYIASGTIYTSLGRESGVQDSTSLFIVTGKDTAATLRVFAVSSKSSACRVVKSSRPVAIGDDVSGKVEHVEEKKPLADTSKNANGVIDSTRPNQRAMPRAAAEKEFFAMQGRVSAQYFTSMYDNTAYNIAQPGIVVNLRGAMRDVPLKLDVYANFRTLSIGNQSPFSKAAVNQSRIYGLSESYDDGENVLSVHRLH